MIDASDSASPATGAPADGVQSPLRLAVPSEITSGPGVEVVVDTVSGALAGVRRGQVTSWLGVPFAAAPVGSLRFGEPQPVPPWTGTRPARSYGPSARQPTVIRLPARLAKLATGGQSEDCLTLNVWSTGPGGDARPVLFWIHGGAFETGSGSLYSGAELAELGDIVVVTVNYRLGALGFVDLRDLFDDDRFASNAGLRDQLAALRWVHDNVGAFGGDPDRVTIAGESAGAGSVGALLVCDRAQGLFAGAICQSGGLNQICDAEHGIEIADVFARQLGVSRENRHDMFTMDADRLTAAMTSTRRLRVEKFSTRPFFDDDLLPATRQQARDYPVGPVPLLSGTNHDEVTMFHALRQKIMPLSRVVVVNAMTHQLGAAKTDAILAMYPNDRAGLVQMGTDLAFEMPSREVAETHARRAPVWRYRFDFPSPMLFGRIGATHGLELWFLFDMQPPRSRRVLLGRDTDEILALSTRMKNAWVNFVRNGDPGNGWAPYTVDGPVEQQRNTMIFDRVDSQVTDPSRERRLVWEPFTPTIP
jgi:para-nitrobenzyl esterase